MRSEGAAVNQIQRSDHAASPVLRVKAGSPPLTHEARKAFSTLQAAAAMRGFRLDLIETDTGAAAYVISRWALTKQLASLDEVSTFLQRVGGTDAR